MIISIVIPVHNAGKYLDRCLESILEALRGAEGEILITNDHSTDNSMEIARKFQEKYPGFIHVMDCDSRGAGAVRNFGANKAQGEYIWFIDADDEINPLAIKKLLSEAHSKDADLVMMGAERIYPDGRHDYLSAVTPNEPNYVSRFVRYGVGPWQVVMRRKWWRKNKFAFREGIIHEDMELMSVLILYANGRFAAVNEPLYYYYQNDGSILHKNEWNPHCLDIFPALEGLYDRFKNIGAEKQYRDELEWFFIWNLLIDSAKDFAKFPEGHSGFLRSRQILKEYFPKWRRNRFLRQKPLKLRIRVRLNYCRN